MLTSLLKVNDHKLVEAAVAFVKRAGTGKSHQERAQGQHSPTEARPVFDVQAQHCGLSHAESWRRMITFHRYFQ